jgi:hypothetical protein
VLRLQELNEKAAIEDARNFLEDRFKAKIMVYSEEDAGRYDPRSRAMLCAPCRPAIYIE